MSSICPTTVTQHGRMFTRGAHGHNHAANPEVSFKAELKVHVIERAKREIFVPATEIVENLLIDKNLHSGLPSLTDLARTANRGKQIIRPQDPTDLTFEINMDFIPGNFIRADIKFDERRHIIFATNEMLNILCRAKRWYLDGTFKIVKEPFIQLFTIHAFVKNDNAIKQLPLLFLLITRKSKIKCLEALPGAPAVNSVVMDFELSLWKVLPTFFSKCNPSRMFVPLDTSSVDSWGYKANI